MHKLFPLSSTESELLELEGTLKIMELQPLDLGCSYSPREMCVVGFSLGAEIGGDGLKLQQERFRLDVKKYLLPKRLVGQWDRLSRGMVESPSVDVFRNHADVALRDSGPDGDELGLGILELFSNHDSVIL